jgi:GT2 family glycosyltransferase
MNKASVVILNWNGTKFLKKFLPGVIEHSISDGIDVIVADNGSTDDSLAILKSDFPQVRIIELDKNYGFAGGYNKALELVDAEYFILLNSDIEVTENWILPIIDYMDNNPQVGACQPKLRNYYDREYFEYAGAAGGFIDKYGYSFCRGRIFDAIEKDNGQYDDIIPVFWATGACMFVRAEAFKKVGCLDDEFFAHMEEIDLCWRLKLAGYSVMYVPFVKVFHVGGGSLPKENPQKTFLNFRNNLYLLYKNLPTHYLYRILIIRIFLDYLAAFKYLINLKFKHFFAIFKSHLNFSRKISYLKSQRSIRRDALMNKALQPEMLGKSLLIEYFIKRNRLFNKIFC